MFQLLQHSQALGAGLIAPVLLYVRGETSEKLHDTSGAQFYTAKSLQSPDTFSSLGFQCLRH